jgi:hypothetical protein
MCTLRLRQVMHLQELQPNLFTNFRFAIFPRHQLLWGANQWQNLLLVALPERLTSSQHTKNSGLLFVTTPDLLDCDQGVVLGISVVKVPCIYPFPHTRLNLRWFCHCQMRGLYLKTGQTWTVLSSVIFNTEAKVLYTSEDTICSEY